MQAFIANYFALSGPAVMAALVTSTIANFVLGGRDLSFPNGLLWKVAGMGVVSGMAASAILALAGVSASVIPVAVGVGVGIGAAFKLRSK